MRILTTIILAALLASAAHAQNGDAVRIGVLNDMSRAFILMTKVQTALPMPAMNSRRRIHPSQRLAVG